MLVEAASPNPELQFRGWSLRLGDAASYPPPQKKNKKGERLFDFLAGEVAHEHKGHNTSSVVLVLVQVLVLVGTV